MPKINKIQIDFGNKIATFYRNGKKRVDLGDGEVAVNTDFTFADGSTHSGIGIFDEFSSGEHCGTMIFTDNDLVEQGSKGFCAALGKTSEQVFPYTYKYRVPLHCDDIHV